jgi:hypothetical protein
MRYRGNGCSLSGIVAQRNIEVTLLWKKTQILRHISIVASRHTILDVYSCSLTGRTVYCTHQYYLCNSCRIVKIKRLISVTATVFILNTVSYHNIK